MNNITIEQAGPSDTETVSSVLQEAASWLIARGTPLWAINEVLPEQIRTEVSEGLFWLATAPLKVGGKYKIKLNTKETQVTVQSIEKVIDTDDLSTMESRELKSIHLSNYSMGVQDLKAGLKPSSITMIKYT